MIDEYGSTCTCAPSYLETFLTIPPALNRSPASTLNGQTMSSWVHAAGEAGQVDLPDEKTWKRLVGTGNSQKAPESSTVWCSTYPMNGVDVTKAAAAVPTAETAPRGVHGARGLHVRDIGMMTGSISDVAAGVVTSVPERDMTANAEAPSRTILSMGH